MCLLKEVSTNIFIEKDIYENKMKFLSVGLDDTDEGAIERRMAARPDHSANGD